MPVFVLFEMCGSDTILTVIIHEKVRCRNLVY